MNNPENTQSTIVSADGDRSSRSLVLRILAILAFAGSMVSAFPPFSSSESAWIALVPLILLARFTPPRRMFRWGFWAGMIFWCLNLYWLLIMMKTGGYPVPVVVAWLALSAYCALYTGVFAMLVSAALERWGMTAASSTGNDESAVLRRPRCCPTDFRGIFLLLFIPILWVGLEYLRSTLLTGFPWNALGVSQYRQLFIIQHAEWGGVYAVSAMVVLLNTALSLTCLRFVDMYRRHKIPRMNLPLLAGLLILVLLGNHGCDRVREVLGDEALATEVRLAAIQPGIPQTQKWTEEFSLEVEDKLLAKTQMAQDATDPDLLIWPETAFPHVLDIGQLASGNAIARTAMEYDTPILAGILEALPPLPGMMKSRLANSSILVGTDGKVREVYRKRHLVIFGEYIPFEKIIPWLSRFAPLGYSCEPGVRPTLFRLTDPDAVFSSLICFEDVFAYLSRDAVLAGARFLVNQTNDAWFDGTAASVQHMTHCVFRCVENRVPAVRVTNTGVTCFIDRAGRLDAAMDEQLRVRALVPPGEACRTDSIYVSSAGHAMTPYTRFGDLLFAIPCAIVAALFFVLVTVEQRRKNKSVL